MSINHHLKYCLIEFLSTKKFESYEFKDIRRNFIEVHSEFKSKKYYLKIYRIIRELESYRLILMDKSTYTFKYSSNYNREELLSILDFDEEKPIREKLIADYHQVKENFLKTQSEIEIYGKYINLYPMIRDKITSCRQSKQLYLSQLESELTVITKLMDLV